MLIGPPQRVLLKPPPRLNYGGPTHNPEKEVQRGTVEMLCLIIYPNINYIININFLNVLNKFFNFPTSASIT